MAQSKTERFELSLHQYSLKPLFDSRQLNLRTYPSFVKQTLGISNIEFAAEFCGDLWDEPAKADEVRRASEQAGVKNRVFLCGAGKGLDATSAAERKESLEEHLRWAEVVERLGCEYIRVRASTEGDRQAQLDSAARGIGELCAALKDSPVSVLIENITGFSRDPSWLLALVERIGVKQVGLLADFGNFDGDKYVGMQQMLPLTKSICTKSWEFDEAGNETTIDFARMMKMIKDSKFQGCIAIEYLGSEPVAGTQKTAALIKRSS
jgi:sugar phosphate isomerase/epimerase